MEGVQRSPDCIWTMKTTVENHQEHIGPETFVNICVYVYKKDTLKCNISSCKCFVITDSFQSIKISNVVLMKLNDVA